MIHITVFGQKLYPLPPLTASEIQQAEEKNSRGSRIEQIAAANTQFLSSLGKRGAPETQQNNPNQTSSNKIQRIATLETSTENRISTIGQNSITTEQPITSLRKRKNQDIQQTQVETTAALEENLEEWCNQAP